MTLPFETTTVAEDPRLETLKKLALHNDFFAKLLRQYRQYGGSLTPKQWACVDREIDKVSAADEGVDFVPIYEKLMSALVAGLKKPAILLANADGFEYRFSLAPQGGVNGGWLYVKVRGETDWGWGWAYLGKVSPLDGQVRCLNGLAVDKAQFVSDMKEILAEGLDAALYNFGAATGNCGCCGRQLTEELSVKSGIGPVCAERFGFDREAIAHSHQ